MKDHPAVVSRKISQAKAKFLNFVGMGPITSTGSPKEYPVIESMTIVEILGLRVRVWRDEEVLQNTYDNSDIVRKVQSFPITGIATDKVGIVRTVLQMDRVTAIEITDERGVGPVVYREWP